METFELKPDALWEPLLAAVACGFKVLVEILVELVVSRHVAPLAAFLMEANPRASSSGDFGRVALGDCSPVRCRGN